MFKLNVLDYLYKMTITENHKSIMTLIMWCLANICAGSIEHCVQIVRHDIMNKVVHFLNNETYKVRKEACSVIDNMLDKNYDEITNILLGLGVVEAIIKIVNEIEDSSFLIIALNALKNLLAISKYRFEVLSDTSLLDKLEMFDARSLIDRIASNSQHSQVVLLCNALLNNYYKCQ
jgi:hypothetical protein